METVKSVKEGKICVWRSLGNRIAIGTPDGSGLTPRLNITQTEAAKLARAIGKVLGWEK